MSDNSNLDPLIYQDDFNPDEKPFMPEGYVKAGVPFLTNYINLFGKKSPFWYVKNDKFIGIHFNHIQMQLPYIILHILLLSSFFIFKYTVYDYYFDEINKYFIFILSLYIMIVISLFRTVFTNPYLPFFYPAQTDRKEFTREEYRLGYAYAKEQSDWAKKQKKPNRSSFSDKAGYFIIRPDHYCAWVQNWIGYKNHRFFIIFTIYGAIYFDILFLNCLHMIYYHRKVHTFLCFSFITLNSGFFSFLFTTQAFIQLNNTSYNITILEIIKRQKNFYNRGCLNNYSEICGSKKLMFLWPWPCISLKPGYNVFNYPEYVGPSYDPKSKTTENENENNKSEDQKLFDENHENPTPLL